MKAAREEEELWLKAAGGGQILYGRVDTLAGKRMKRQEGDRNKNIPLQVRHNCSAFERHFCTQSIIVNSSTLQLRRQQHEQQQVAFLIQWVAAWHLLLSRSRLQSISNTENCISNLNSIKLKINTKEALRYGFPHLTVINKEILYQKMVHFI